MFWSLGCAAEKPAPSKTESIQRGDELARQQDYPKAVQAYRSAVTADPKDGHLRIKLADIYRLAGDEKAAAAEAIQAADLLPGDDEAQLLAATMMLTQYRFVDVSDRMTAFLATHPDHPRAILLKANATAHLRDSGWALYSLSGAIQSAARFEGARREIRPGTAAADDVAAEKGFRKAWALAPDLPESRMALANFLWAVGRPDEGEPMLRSFADGNPLHAAANYALGAYYLARKRNSDGERYLKNAAAIGDYGRDARFMLADHYIATKRDQDAVAVLRSMSPQDDAAGAVSVRLAAIDFRAGRHEQAVARIEQLLRTQPLNAPALLLKAQFLLHGRQLDQAQAVARAALAANPQSSEAHATLGRILTVTGDSDGAFAEFSAALRLRPDADDLPLPLAQVSMSLGLHKQALQFARDAKRHHPNDPQASLTLVKAQILTHDYSAANLELKPLLVGTPSPDVLVQLGTVQAALNNTQAARAAFARALTADGQSLDALAGLVSLDLKAGRMTQARRAVDQALTSHANDPGYLMLAAKVYGAQNDTARTQQALEQVLAIDPTNVGAAIWLADELGRQHQSDAARKVLEQLLEHRPQSVDAETALARRLELDGHIDEARKRYEKIVALNPEAAQAAHRLAAIYVAETRNLDVALNHASTAKRLLPHDPDVMDTLGWVYVAKNQWPQAARHLSDAVEAVPDNPIYRYHLGVAYLRSGNLKRAESEFQHALKIDPNYQFAEQTRALLASIRK